jgi:hypothetical protein
LATINTIRDVKSSYHRGEREMMNENNEQDEVIEFCLKHDLIKKTDQGYIIKREFFEILDVYNE